MSKEKSGAFDISADDLALVTAYLAAEEKRHKERTQHPYDGVLGVLPHWFPKLNRDEFLRLRDKIFDLKEIQPEQVKGWVEAYLSIGGEGLVPPWPHKWTEEVGRLGQFYAAFRMGEEKGLRFMLGEDQAKTLNTGKQIETGRRTAGKRRAEQKQQQGKQTERQVKETETELRKQGIRRGINKLIAKQLNLSVDHVRKIRKKRI